jgi:hypothetical protein
MGDEVMSSMSYSGARDCHLGQPHVQVVLLQVRQRVSDQIQQPVQRDFLLHLDQFSVLHDVTFHPSLKAISRCVSHRSKCKKCTGVNVGASGANYSNETCMHSDDDDAKYFHDFGSGICRKYDIISENLERDITNWMLLQIEPSFSASGAHSLKIKKGDLQSSVSFNFRDPNNSQPQLAARVVFRQRRFMPSLLSVYYMSV